MPVAGGAILAAGAFAGCGVTWDAPEIDIVATSDEIVFASQQELTELVGGETIIRLTNDSEERRRLVLARIDEGGEIPQKLHAAAFPKDDNRILDMTSELRARRRSLRDLTRFELASASFHVHLQPGDTYVIFDTLDEPGQGAMLRFTVRKD